MSEQFKYIYGPLYSWRLGRSLGIDPLATPEKVCTFDCVYCQLGKTVRFDFERREFVPSAAIMDEIRALPEDCEIDYLTFSGRGEPTLAANLGEMIDDLRKIRPEPIAVITNSSLMDRPDVRLDLAMADMVVAKLDAHSDESFRQVDQAHKVVDFSTMLRSIQLFREDFSGKFALQIMFIPENKCFAGEIAKIAVSLAPDEIQLNTPTRPSGATVLTPEEMEEVKRDFSGMHVISVYDAETKSIEPFDHRGTVLRHGMYGPKKNISKVSFRN
ncbi:MAG: radical SAM protein [Candidatus Omnitrophota bacterium]|nr:radical SAM protein [Candidatus Omnitrophota bacterium]MDZ4243016.1 radical SAM protein [Candidatus Omnitrophota bacterium]